MRLTILCLAAVLAPALAAAQAAPQPTAAVAPTLEEVRKSMGIASEGDVRGQQDIVGFASQPAQMAKVWNLASSTTGLTLLGDAPAGNVVGVLCPHDDYLYAGRAYRQVLPLVKARTVVLVGVFHKYRRFRAHDVVVFDPYRAWRSPDGEIKVSGLRDEVVKALPAGDFLQSAAMHDSEHSLEALAYWLKHIRPDLEILPIIVPACPYPRMDELASHVSAALAAAMKRHGLELGRDVAVAISSDAVHYGSDFKHVPFGEGGIDAYSRAVARDVELMKTFEGPMSAANPRRFYEACVNPDNPSEYRLTWCGRFSIPFGLLLLKHLASQVDPAAGALVGHPLSYSTSVGQPELAVRELGMGETAPANLYHFVGYPAAAFVTSQPAP